MGVGLIAVLGPLAPGVFGGGPVEVVGVGPALGGGWDVRGDGRGWGWDVSAKCGRGRKVMEDLGGGRGRKVMEDDRHRQLVDDGGRRVSGGDVVAADLLEVSGGSGLDFVDCVAGRDEHGVHDVFLAIGGIVQLLGLYEVLGRFLYHDVVSDGLGLGSIVVDKLFAGFEVSLGPGDGLFFEL